HTRSKRDWSADVCSSDLDDGTDSDSQNASSTGDVCASAGEIIGRAGVLRIAVSAVVSRRTDDFIFIPLRVQRDVFGDGFFEVPQIGRESWREICGAHESL